MAIKKYASAKGVDFKYAKGSTDIFGNTFHHRFELYLFLGGNVELITDHVRTRLRPYQLVIIPPERYHQLSVIDAAENYERCVLNLDTDFLGTDILQNALSGKDILSLTEFDRIVTDFLYLKEQTDISSEADMHCLLPAIACDIVFCIKRATCTDTETHGGIGMLSRDIVNYLNSHYTENIDLDMLSNKFHVSVSTLCHIFKKDFGITVKQYIMQKRLNAAKHYLDLGEGAEAVCEKVGFTNYSAFFRAYKKHFSASPSQSSKS